MNKSIKPLSINDFPVAIVVLCVLLFLMFWILALWGETGLKPIHFTLLNFVLVAVIGLQNYRRFSLDPARGTFRLISFGLLSGRNIWSGEINSINNVRIEPGLGGFSSRGGRLLLIRNDQEPLIISSADLLPGSHKKLEVSHQAIVRWLERYQQASEPEEAK